MLDIRLTGIETVPPFTLSDGVALYNIPPPPMLIEDVLPRASIVGLTAPPGTGKTWLTMEMIRAVATGTDFLGHYPVEGAYPCLFVGSDASLYDYAQQWRRLTLTQWSALTEQETNLLEDNVKFLIQSPFMFEDMSMVRQLISTNLQYKWGEYEDWVLDRNMEIVPVVRHHTGFRLIVFDTLSKLTRANQNDNTEMEEVFRNIRLISEQTGATIVLLHHNSKPTEFNGGTDWRGAVAQLGALDTWLHMIPSRRDKYTITVDFKKFRGITPPPYSYVMRVGDEADASLDYVDPSTVAETTFTDGLADDILTAMTDGPAAGKWMSVNQIADAMWEEYGLNYGNDRAKFTAALRRRLNEMVRAVNPRVWREGGGQGKRALYRAGNVTDTEDTSGEEDELDEVGTES